MNRIKQEMEYQQQRFYRRLKERGKLVVEFWPGAKKFLDGIPGIAWEKQGNKILIKEIKTDMKTFRDILVDEKSFKLVNEKSSTIKVKTDKGEVSLKGNDSIEYEAKPGVVRIGMAGNNLKPGIKFKKGGKWFVVSKKDTFPSTGTPFSEAELT